MPFWRITKLIVIVPYSILWAAHIILTYFVASFLGWVFSGKVSRFYTFQHQYRDGCPRLNQDGLPWHWRLERQYPEKFSGMKWWKYEWEGVIPFPKTVWNLFEAPAEEKEDS